MLRIIPRIALFAFITLSLAVLDPALTLAQRAPAQATSAGPFGALRWRSLGPARGGRSIAVAGSESRPNEYYMGATGGGLWKTTDGGMTWKPVTDGQINNSSVGAVAVSAVEPRRRLHRHRRVRHPRQHHPGRRRLQVHRRRQDVDAHRPRRHAGHRARSASTRPIPTSSTSPRSAITPRRIPERGVFRSKDGGKTWDKILFRDDKTGGDRTDPRSEQSRRSSTPRSGRRTATRGRCRAAARAAASSSRPTAAITGPRSRRNPGLPKAMLGKIGLSVSGADSNRVYAQIEADDGGFFLVRRRRRDVDEGERAPRPAAARVLLHARLRRSQGQGHGLRAERRTSTSRPTAARRGRRSRVPHGDNHDMWIAPNDSNRMIEANDGGANVSVNGGETWTAGTMPTAQFYHVITTTHVPYHVCGAQQDNSTACVSSQPRRPAPADRRRRRSGVLLGRRRRERLHRQRPAQPGHLLRRQLRRPASRGSIGAPASSARSTRIPTTRWATRRPTSPSDSSGRSRSCSRRPIRHVALRRLAASLEVHQRGPELGADQPDLTRHDPKTMGASGGPITKDNTASKPTRRSSRSRRRRATRTSSGPARTTATCR